MLFGSRLLLMVAALAAPAATPTATPAGTPAADHHAQDRSVNVALGVECVHCHNPPAPRLQCFLCHQGQVKPERSPAA